MTEKDGSYFYDFYRGFCVIFCIGGGNNPFGLFFVCRYQPDDEIWRKGNTEYPFMESF